MKRRWVLTQIIGRRSHESKGCPKEGEALVKTRWFPLFGAAAREGWSRAREIDDGNDGAIADSPQITRKASAET